MNFTSLQVFLISFLAMALVSVLYHWPWVLFGVLLFISGVWLYFLRQPIYLKIFGVVAVGGPIAEAVAIHFGAWWYTTPQLIGFPVWLPPLWGLAAVGIVVIFEQLR